MKARAALHAAVLGVFLTAALPATGVTLKVGASDRPPGLGNPYESVATLASHTRAALLDGLTRLGPGNTFEPALAESWEASGPTGWIFRLKPGLTFSNGEPVDAAAVKATLDYLIRPESARLVIAQEVKRVARVEIIDPLTVHILTSEPDALLPRRLSLVMIVPPRYWEEVGIDGFANAPIGSGAYILDDWGTQSGRTELTANPKSWRAPEQIDRVEIYNPLRDAVVRLQALRSGQVDITLNISVDEMETAAAEGFINTVQPVATIQSLAFKTVGVANSPLLDQRVRQALNYAVNKEAIAEIIMGGTVGPVGQGAIPGITGYNPDIGPYPYDPGRAKALLAEAGYGDGFTLDAEVLQGNNAADSTAYIQVAQDLAKVGVTLQIRGLVGTEWIRKYFTSDWGSADVLSMTWSAGAYGDTIRAIDNFSCARANPFFCEPALSPMITASNETFDPVARERILQDIMARLHDLAPAIFLYHHGMVISHHPRVTTVVLGGGGFMFERMRMAEGAN